MFVEVVSDINSVLNALESSAGSSHIGSRLENSEN
jgi:hypothetical protein